MNFSRFLDVVVAYLNPQKVNDHRIETPVTILDTDSIAHPGVSGGGVSASINLLPTVVIETRVEHGLRWTSEQPQSCSWTGTVSTTWPANAKQSCRWIPGYINVWVSLNDATCSWTGSLGAHITSGWVLDASQECEWFVVNTDPGDWVSEQVQLCEWVPTIQAIPEPCLSGDGLPEGASRGANYCF